MSEKTNIAWTDSTVNFWSGCSKVSDGCKNCYAEALSNRALGNIGKWGNGAPRQLHESAFKLAHKLNWKPWICDECGLAIESPSSPYANHKAGHNFFHPRRIFSLSLGDWLDPEVPIEWLARMLDTIRRCDQVDWLLCTKRPELWRSRLEEVIVHLPDRCLSVKKPDDVVALERWLADWLDNGKPPTNIWILTSVENQETVDKRIPELLKIPAVVRGLSCEPLLGPIDLGFATSCDCVSLSGKMHATDCPLCKPKPDWIIVGGESGKNARHCNIEWIRSIKDQCAAASVPCFVKQLGSNPTMPGVQYATAIPVGIECKHGSDVCPICDSEDRPLYPKLKHSKGGDPSEWSEDLRVRQFPEVAR